MQKKLSLTQEKAIRKIYGPCMILAGAGTGKTFTIVEKMKYLIKNKIYNPEKIVCITFSNEAANNLLLKIRKELDLEENKVIIKTFHSFSSMLLKKYGNKIGIKENFTILTPDETMILLHSQMNISPEYCQKYINTISTAKDMAIKIEDLEDYLCKKNIPNIDILKEKLESMQIENHIKNKKKDNVLREKIKKTKKFLEIRKFINIWKAYEKIKSKENYQDYSDLNNNAVTLLKNFPEIAKAYDYLIVDEFQDTNKVQLDLIFLLSHNKSITVVGDLNQSIYRFRGALHENIVYFKKHFNIGEQDVFTLDKSFRSPNRILNASYELIKKNYKNDIDLFYVENIRSEEGEKIKVFELKDQNEEAIKVSEIIEEEIKKGVEKEKICVIFRTHAQAEIIKKVLDMKSIPYTSSNKKTLLKCKEIKKIINYLNIVSKIKNNGKTSAYELWDLLRLDNLHQNDLFEIGRIIKKSLENNKNNKELIEELKKAEISQEGKIKINFIIKNIENLSNFEDKDLLVMLESIYSSSFTEQERTQEAILNLSRLYELAKNYSEKKYPSLKYFLEYVAAIQRLDIQIESAEQKREGIKLMTAHSTKGLEYETVIITNLVEKRFPIEKKSNNSIIPLELYPDLKEKIKNLNETEKENFLEEYETENNIFEERRLCYVSMTRARKRLFITYSQNYHDRKHLPSRFLEEMGYKKNKDFSFCLEEKRKFPEIQEKNKQEIEQIKLNTKMKFEEEITFSPSSLLKFIECEKKFEYEYVYKMPEKTVESWESIKKGSLTHLIIEQGIKKNFKTLKEFSDLAKEICEKEEINSEIVEEILYMIKIFYERNKNKYKENSLSEQPLSIRIDNKNFYGKADRIDFNKDGIEIIEYKTGKAKLSALYRNWQIGYYALSAEKFGKVKKVTLDMLNQEKSFEFEIKENGDAFDSFSKRFFFNIYEIKKELSETAEKVIEAYYKGFKPCTLEKNCEFCNEYVYNK